MLSCLKKWIGYNLFISLFVYCQYAIGYAGSPIVPVSRITPQETVKISSGWLKRLVLKDNSLSLSFGYCMPMLWI